MPADLRHICTFKQLVRYLEDELGWPLDGYDVDELTFDYDAEELGLKPAEAAKVKTIRQLRPISDDQPWGIFFIEFDRKRLPVVVLRRILSHLVIKKRASASKAHRAAWNAADLLFISAFGPDGDGREIGFAHFHQEDGDLPSPASARLGRRRHGPEAQSCGCHARSSAALARKGRKHRAMARALGRGLPPSDRVRHQKV